MDWTSSAGNVSRIETWKKCWDKIVDSHFLGYGPGTSGNAAVKLGLKSASYVTESSYLKLILELGMLGFILFMLVYFTFLRRNLRMVISQGKNRSDYLAISILGALIGLAFEMAIYQSIETQVAQSLLWFFLAAITIMHLEKSNNIRPKQDNSPQKPDEL